MTRYLGAFGPASGRDVAAWSGLTGLGPVLERLRPSLVTFRDERGAELFDLPSAPRPGEDEPAPVRLTAEFDNLLLSHADRSRVIQPRDMRRFYTINGIFPGSVLIDGFVAGMWRLARAKGTATLTIELFTSARRGMRSPRKPGACLPSARRRPLTRSVSLLLRDLLPGPGGAGDSLAKLKISIRSPAEPFCWRAGPYIVEYIVLSFPLHRAALAVILTAGMGLGLGGYAAQTAYAAVEAPAGGPPSSHVSSALVPGPAASAGTIRVRRARPVGPAPGSNWCRTSSPRVRGGITAAQVARIRKLGGVAAVLPVDGGKVMVNGRSADVLGVSPQAFRPWTPLATAASAAVWSGLAKGELISTRAAASKLKLAAGKAYPVSAAVREQVLFGGRDRAQRAWR